MNKFLFNNNDYLIDEFNNILLNYDLFKENIDLINKKFNNLNVDFKLLNSNVNFKFSKINIFSNDSDFSNFLTSNVLHNSFIDKKIISFYYKTPYKFKISLSNIFFFYYNHEKKYVDDVFLNHCFFIINYFNYFNYDKLPIKVYFFDNYFNKIIDYNNSIILPSFLNSAVTYYKINKIISKNKSFKMCIYRNEEYKRIFIHEIIHYLNLDFKSHIKCNCNRKFCYEFLILGDN
jgi:hypothetical protein